MSNITWIKITTNIFDDEKITFLEQMPESDTLIVIWFKLLTLAGKKNDCGLLYLTKDIPYDDAILMSVLKRPLNIIKLALATFEKLGMIEITENNYIAITNWEKHQNVEGMEKLKIQWKEASQRYREKQKLQIENHKTSYDCHNTEKRREEKNREDKKVLEKKSFKKPTKEELQQYFDYLRKEKNKYFNFTTDKFLSHYESNGWMVGKNKMKCWKSAVRTWIENEKEKGIDKFNKNNAFEPWKK